MKRRDFFIKTISLGSGFVLNRGLNAAHAEAGISKSRVVIFRDSRLHIRQN